jgi:hypothetical protein
LESHWKYAEVPAAPYPASVDSVNFSRRAIKPEDKSDRFFPLVFFSARHCFRRCGHDTVATIVGIRFGIDQSLSYLYRFTKNRVAYEP